MTSYQEMSKEQLLQEKTALEAEYAKIKEMGLSLDMSIISADFSFKYPIKLETLIIGGILTNI